MTFEMLLQVISMFSIIGGGFYFTGKVTQTLSNLTNIAQDHEERIRGLEKDNA